MSTDKSDRESKMRGESPKSYMSTQVVPDPPPAYKGASGQYQDHLLQQHTHYVDVTMKYWSHVEPANQFFLSLHTVILSGFIYMLTSKVNIPPLLLLGLTVMSFGVALQWLMLLRSMQKVNQVRHEIIQEWEKHLPAHPYRVEYYKLYMQRTKLPRYFRVQRLYMLIPVLAMIVYVGIGLSIALDIRAVIP